MLLQCNCSNETWGRGLFRGHWFVSFQPVTKVTSGPEKLRIKQLEHDRKGKKVEKQPSYHQVGQVIGEKKGLTCYILNREERRKEGHREAKWLPWSGGERPRHDRAAALQQQGWRSMSEMPQKELAGQTELPGQEKGEDRKGKKGKCKYEWQGKWEW